MKNFKLKLYGDEYVAHFIISKYTYGGGLYVGIELEDGEPWDDLSTNLEFDLPENTIAIKEYDSGKYYMTLLSDLGIIKNDLGVVEQGYGTFKIVELDYQKLIQYGQVI